MVYYFFEWILVHSKRFLFLDCNSSHDIPRVILEILLIMVDAYFWRNLQSSDLQLTWPFSEGFVCFLHVVFVEFHLEILQRQILQMIPVIDFSTANFWAFCTDIYFFAKCRICSRSLSFLSLVVKFLIIFWQLVESSCAINLVIVNQRTVCMDFPLSELGHP